MTATDGAIVFAFCALSFALGYAIGAIRVARAVTKRLDEVQVGVEQVQKYGRELQGLYAKLGGTGEERQ